MAFVTGSTLALAPNTPEQLGDSAPILEIRDLRAEFDTAVGGAVAALDGVSFNLLPRETLGVAGGPGSGKSLTALSIMRLMPDNCVVTGGEILFRGRDILTMSEREVMAIRGRDLAMIFQDPMTSLNPVLR